MTLAAYRFKSPKLRARKTQNITMARFWGKYCFSPQRRNNSSAVVVCFPLWLYNPEPRGGLIPINDPFTSYLCQDPSGLRRLRSNRNQPEPGSFTSGLLLAKCPAAIGASEWVAALWKYHLEHVGSLSRNVLFRHGVGWELQHHLPPPPLLL